VIRNTLTQDHVRERTKTSRSEEREGEDENPHLSRDEKRPTRQKKYGELMARVMLVIREIVDRRTYNRVLISST